MCNNISAAWWDNGWEKRQEIILMGNTSGAQTNYQVLINVSYQEGMQSDFDDLRFCNNTHQIDAWLEFKVDGSYALVWVEFPTTPANTVEQTYYMYYGKTDAASDWDIGETFIFGDDFEDGTLNAWSGATSAYDAVGGAAYEGSYGCDRTQVDGSWQFLVGTGDVHNGIWEAWFKQGVDNGYPNLQTRYLDDTHYINFQIQANTNQIGINDIGGTGSHTAALSNSVGVWYFVRGTLDGTDAKLQVYDTSMNLLQTLQVTVTDRTDAFGFSCYRDAQFDTYRVRKYAANPPIYELGDIEDCPQIYVPPTPQNLINITGNFFINHSWTAGTGNVTDGYNITVNDTWHNITNSYYNNTNLIPHDWSNISIYAYNSTDNGSLSDDCISQNTLIPNNPVTIDNIHDWADSTGDNVFVNANGIDADGDTLTFSCNRLDLFTDFNTEDGTGNYTFDGDYVIVEFGVSDGYGSISNKTMNIKNILLLTKKYDDDYMSGFYGFFIFLILISIVLGGVIHAFDNK